MEKSNTIVKEIHVFGYGSIKTMMPGPIYRGEFGIELDGSMVFVTATAPGEKSILIYGQKQHINIGDKIIIPVSSIMYMDNLREPEPFNDESQETE